MNTKKKIEWNLNEHKNELEIYVLGNLAITYSDVMNEEEALELVNDFESGVNL